MRGHARLGGGGDTGRETGAIPCEATAQNQQAHETPAEDDNADTHVIDVCSRPVR
jgi:hypothetical protein